MSFNGKSTLNRGVEDVELIVVFILRIRLQVKNKDDKDLTTRLLTPPKRRQNMSANRKFGFFPGEAKHAKELRLLLRAIDTGKTYMLNLKF